MSDDRQTPSGEHHQPIKKAPDSLKNLHPSCLTNDDSTTAGLRILIIHAEWNKVIINNLLKFSILTLKSLNLKTENILIQSVPGSYELPWACNTVLSNPSLHKEIDAIIAIGVLIKGDTMHFEYIADSVSKNLMKVSIDHNKPIIFGVLTCLNESQALIRSGLDPSSPSNHNHAIDWAKAAVDCALNSRRLSNPSISIQQQFTTAQDESFIPWWRRRSISSRKLSLESRGFLFHTFS